VKYLTDCVEELVKKQNRDEKNEEPIYGIPGSSRTTGSQQEPIFISDDDIKIKVEFDITGPTTTENTATKKRASGKRAETSDRTRRDTKRTRSGIKRTRSGIKRTRSGTERSTRQGEKSGDTSTGTTTTATPTTATTGKGKGKERARSDSSEHTSSDNSSSSSTSSTSPNIERASNVFFKKEKMPNDLRESLRVIKNNHLLLFFYILTIDIIYYSGRLFVIMTRYRTKTGSS
jgi:hypothetical protein